MEQKYCEIISHPNYFHLRERPLQLTSFRVPLTKSINHQRLVPLKSSIELGNNQATVSTDLTKVARRALFVDTLGASYAPSI